MILLQQLLTAATRVTRESNFDKQELEAAALAVCQYLAVESAHPSTPVFEECNLRVKLLPLLQAYSILDLQK
uniref:E3 ubiquitin-protein ligase herc2 n=1 Tax=Sphaerodactylus townsendi TaxID=933632 RepID=A0ACB8FIN5_9SAUR